MLYIAGGKVFVCKMCDYKAGTIEFAGTDPTKLMLVDEVTLPGGVPGAEYTAGVMKVETSACASFTFVGCAA